MLAHTEMKHFKAPWGRSLIVLSALSTLLCLGIAFFPHTAATAANGHFFWLRLLPVLLIIGAAVFTIRGYTITPEAILVRRLWWTTRLPLTHLESAEFRPDAMRGSIHTFGNGGFFSFSGFYRSRLLGSFRAFVTDLHPTVILRYRQRTIVVSPSDPESFIHDVIPSDRNA
jgi:hypothetical protein